MDVCVCACMYIHRCISTNMGMLSTHAHEQSHKVTAVKFSKMHITYPSGDGNLSVCELCVPGKDCPKVSSMEIFVSLNLGLYVESFVED